MEGMDAKMILTILATSFGAMSAAVATMWKTLIQRTHKTEEKLEQCEIKHAAAQETMLELTERVGRLEGEVSGYSKAHSDIMSMSEDVKTMANALREIHEKVT